MDEGNGYEDSAVYACDAVVHKFEPVSFKIFVEPDEVVFLSLDKVGFLFIEPKLALRAVGGYEHIVDKSAAFSERNVPAGGASGISHVGGEVSVHIWLLKRP